MRRISLVAVLLMTALVLSGCSSLGEVFRVPTGPNAPFKSLSAEQAQDASIFRGIVSGRCEPVTARIDGFADLDRPEASKPDGYMRVGCLLPVVVGNGPAPFRRILCAGPEIEPKCLEWGRRPNRVEVSFMGSYLDFDRQGVYLPAGKDQLKGREI